MLGELLRAIGFGLCHQLPERSFFGGGVQVPVCARDTGIYIGYVVSVIAVIALHYPKRPRRFFTLAGWVVAALFVGAMAVDGVTSYAGIRETTNAVRLLTGTLAGFAVGALVVPLLYGELFRESDPEHVLQPVWRLATWLALVPVTVAIVWFGGPALGVGYPILVALAVIATFTSVNMVFAAVLTPFDRAARGARDLLGPAAIGLALTVVELIGAGLLRILFNALASRVV